jgi:hypothetical protein
VIEHHGAEDWVRWSGGLFRPADAVPTLPAGENTVTFGPEGYGEWRRVPAYPAPHRGRHHLAALRQGFQPGWPRFRPAGGGAGASRLLAFALRACRGEREHHFRLTAGTRYLGPRSRSTLTLE